jgi:sugar phosphate isomerase/epimerase
LINNTDAVRVTTAPDAAPFGRLSLHTWTLDTTDLPTAIDAAKRGGFDAMELRWTDFKRCFEKGMTNAQVLDVIRAGGLPVATLGVEYGWIFAKGEESKRLWGVFRQSCENAVALNCSMLMSAPGPVTGTIKEAIANLRLAGDLAAEFGLKLALEFNSQHEVINCLEVQHEVVKGANKPNCGILLDAYHLARSGAPGRGFESVAPEDIFAFQYSDLPEHPVTGVKRPTDRLAAGKGTVRWSEVFGLLAEKNYRGFLSYEVPNPELWQRSPYDVAAEGVIETRKLLKAAGVVA